jgi:REP element-mobilizing transposase RayT
MLGSRTQVIDHPTMPSTYTSLQYHLIFGTKHRQQMIHPKWRRRMHQYLGGTVRGLEGMPLKINGVSDHVQLLVGLKPTHRLCDFIRELKRSSSGWIHEEIGLKPFAWQEGYAAFSVGCRQRSRIAAYIENQEEHHRSQSFREELIGMLDEAEITFDPKYLQ